MVRIFKKGTYYYNLEERGSFTIENTFCIATTAELQSTGMRKAELVSSELECLVAV